MAAYLVFTRLATTDQAALDIYHGQAPAAGAGHPVTPLVAYGDFDVLEGPPHEGMVILSFPDAAAARAMYNSPAYTAAREQRFKGAEYQVTLVEGV